MADPHLPDPQNLAGWAAVLATIWAFLMWPFRTFETRKAAEKKYLKIIEDDGSFRYVPASRFEALEKKVEESLEESRKWRDLAERWMKQP